MSVLRVTLPVRCVRFPIGTGAEVGPETGGRMPITLRICVTILFLSAVTADATETARAAECGKLREAAAVADAALRDCLGQGGGCSDEFATRESARVAVGDCPQVHGTSVSTPSTPAPVATPAPVIPPAVAAPLAMSATGTYADGFMRGEMDANAAGTGGWGGGGVASGCLLGGIGCLGLTAIGYAVDPAVPQHVVIDRERSQEFRLGYQQAYEKRLKKRRSKAAFIGGTVGTLVFVTVYLSVVSAASADEGEESSAASSAIGIRF